MEQSLIDPASVYNKRFPLSLEVTGMKAMNFQDDIPSIAFDNFKDHYVLVFDLITMQDATKIFYYPELFSEPLRLELNFTFPLEQVTELIVLEERMSWVAVESLAFLERMSKMDNVAFQQKFNRNLLFKYRYLGSFLSN